MLSYATGVVVATSMRTSALVFANHFLDDSKNRIRTSLNNFWLSLERLQERTFQSDGLLYWTP